MKKIYLLLVISIFLLLNCKKKKEEVKLIPLSVGNSWDYKGWYIENSDTSLLDAFEMKIVVQRSDTFYFTGSLFTFEELAEEETMKIIMRDSCYFSCINEEPDTQLVLPLKQGNSWRVNEDFTAEILGMEEVMIDNNKYSNCWRIKYQDEDGDIQKEIWVKEGTGVIKFQRKENGEIMILELKEHNLKK